MSFSYLDEKDKKMSKLPPQRVNGGLYTGVAARGPWGSVPVIPDEVYLTNQNLRSANPPMDAITQYTNGIRPGNNLPQHSKINKFSDSHDIVCTGKLKSFDTKSYDPTQSTFMLI